MKTVVDDKIEFDDEGIPVFDVLDCVGCIHKRFIDRDKGQAWCCAKKDFGYNYGAGCELKEVPLK
jgi:hypothetical protein